MFTTQSGVQDNSPAHRAGRSGRPSVPPEPASTALSLTDHTGAVESVAFSPDGRRIVSDGWDKTLRESHTADAARRTRAPSPTPRPPPAPPGTLMHVQSGTPTALTCRSPAPRAGPAPRYALPGDPPTSGRAFRTRYAGPATLAAPPRAQLLLPRVPGHRPTSSLRTCAPASHRHDLDAGVVDQHRSEIVTAVSRAIRAGCWACTTDSGVLACTECDAALHVPVNAAGVAETVARRARLRRRAVARLVAMHANRPTGADRKTVELVAMRALPVTVIGPAPDGRL